MLAPHGTNSLRLTDCHREILIYISKGLRNAEIGHQLNLTERTVKGYVSQLFLIFDVTNRTELVGLFAHNSIGTSDILV
jgi:DNA-binding NarL/FixJ family response regulator